MFAFRNFTYAPGTVLAVFEDGCIEKNIGFAECVGGGPDKLSDLAAVDTEICPVFLFCNIIGPAEMHWVSTMVPSP